MIIMIHFQIEWNANKWDSTSRVWYVFFLCIFSYRKSDWKTEIDLLVNQMYITCVIRIDPLMRNTHSRIYYQISHGICLTWTGKFWLENWNVCNERERVRIWFYIFNTSFSSPIFLFAFLFEWFKLDIAHAVLNGLLSIWFFIFGQ